jgi:hypothetical protein
LKEKRSADKRGDGMDALRLAEKSTDINMEDGRANPENSSPNAGPDNDLMDEVAARKAIAERTCSPLKSLSPSGSTVGDLNAVEESVILEEDEAKLLGLRNGGQMKKILDSDRAKKGKVKVEKVLGVKLWDDTPRPVHCPIVKPEFPSLLVDQQPVFRLLRNAWRSWSGKWDLSITTSVLMRLWSRRWWRCDAGRLGHLGQPRILQIRAAHPISLRIG